MSLQWASKQWRQVLLLFSIFALSEETLHCHVPFPDAAHLLSSCHGQALSSFLGLALTPVNLAVMDTNLGPYIICNRNYFLRCCTSYLWPCNRLPRQCSATQLTSHTVSAGQQPWGAWGGSFCLWMFPEVAVTLSAGHQSLRLAQGWKTCS